jgi:hypothetical protein
MPCVGLFFNKHIFVDKIAPDKESCITCIDFLFATQRQEGRLLFAVAISNKAMKCNATVIIAVIFKS